MRLIKNTLFCLLNHWCFHCRDK